MNKAFLIGNLTKDPELRTTSSGISVCTFSIAVNRKFTNQQGVREADFFNIVAWRGLADNCAKYLAKGRKVSVVGQIQNRSYDAQDGTKRYITEIVADDIEFLSAQSQSGEGSHQASSQNAPPPTFNSEAGFTQVDDDELPF